MTLAATKSRLVSLVSINLQVDLWPKGLRMMRLLQDLSGALGCLSPGQPRSAPVRPSRIRIWLIYLKLLRKIVISFSGDQNFSRSTADQFQIFAPK